MKKHRQRLDWDKEKNQPVIRELAEGEKWKFDFGESVGMIVIGLWYPNISHGHPTYGTTYDFAIRFKFIESAFTPDDLPEEEARECGGWNVPEWIRCARELEEEGVQAIVCGCGLTGTIQRTLADSVSIPVFTSSVLFVPLISRGLKKGQKVGIITVSTELFTRWDNKLLRECGIDESTPVVIAGMAESQYAGAFWSQLKPSFDEKELEQALVHVAEEMIAVNPDVGTIVLECTEMPPYSTAVRQATGLPVFDTVDMVKCVYNMVTP